MWALLCIISIDSIDYNSIVISVFCIVVIIVVRVVIVIDVIVNTGVFA